MNQSNTLKRRAANGSNADRPTKRPVIACNACRKKKVKCSGDRPACTNCLRLSIPCKYPIVKNRGARFSYREMLLKRLDLMQKHLDDKSTAKELLHMENDKSDRDDTDSPLSSSANENMYKVRQRNAAAAAAQKSWNGPSNADLVRRRKGSGYPLKFGVEIDAPEPHILEHLVELFFIHIHNQEYFFLHRRTFITKLREGKVKPSLLFAVCAISARFSNHPDVEVTPRHFAGDKFMVECRKLLANEYDQPSIETCQALIIVIIHDFLSLNGEKAAIITAIIMRMCIVLGLNEESTDPNMSFIDRETRRRLWWSAMTMDRLVHSGPTRTFLLDEDDCMVQLPCSSHDFDYDIPVVLPRLDGTYDPNADPKLPKVKPDIVAYHLKSTLIWGRVVLYINDGRKREDFSAWSEFSTFHKLEKEVSTFYAELPPELTYNKRNLDASAAKGMSGMFVHLHIIIQTSSFALHRCIYPYDHASSKFDIPPISFIERSANKLTAAACSISTILQDALQVSDVLPAPFLGFCAFTSAHVHIANSFSVDEEVSQIAKQHLAANLRFLVLLREHWDIAVIWCSTLKERYSEKLARRGESVGNKGDHSLDSPISPDTQISYGSFQDSRGLRRHNDEQIVQYIPLRNSHGRKSDQPRVDDAHARIENDNSSFYQTGSDASSNYSRGFGNGQTSNEYSGIPQKHDPMTSNFSNNPHSEMGSHRQSTSDHIDHNMMKDLSSHFGKQTSSNEIFHSAFSEGAESDKAPTRSVINDEDFSVLASKEITSQIVNEGWPLHSDKEWLRAVEENVDEVVIDTTRIGESSFLDLNI
ncbi:hypothetical protein CANCADRAFT_55792 [Tortispora caseinolytica NRRL Y-17796]|uniref:Zn(2)-C6 fungal-type domain-containing protein n=1 Tax=Tortispora caseinolytica NRRL Y-17796 TaxID=767744 RepID=A0A1E4TJY6_9ASCO|nr:hypothetical protein CANCADRAFT_55792 [Tortispora caseinolytica NRRL Y-17796]